MMADHGPRRFLALIAAGLACACGDTHSPIAPPAPNLSPTGARLTISPDGLALVGAPMTFSASATDPDGDGLSYAWNFGDGGTGAGATTTHTYTNSNVHTVTVTVSDGKGGTAAASAGLQSRSLGGNWLEFDDRRYGYVLQQAGSTLSGSRIDRLRAPGTVDAGILTGTVLDARRVRFEVFYSRTNDTDTITATLDAGLVVMNYNIRPANVTSMLVRE